MLPPSGYKAGFSWLRSTVVSLAEFSTKQFTIAPLAVRADVKDKYCGTTYFKCMRQICVNKLISFPLPCLSFRSPFGHTSFLHSFALSLSPVSSLCLYGEFNIKNWKEAWFPSLSSPSIPLTNLVWYCPTPPLAHHRPRQVSPISKVKPPRVSWRAAMVLTRLSLYATLPARLPRGLTSQGYRPWLCHSLPVSHCAPWMLPPDVLSSCYPGDMKTHSLFERQREWGAKKTERGRDDFWWRTLQSLT